LPTFARIHRTDRDEEPAEYRSHRIDLPFGAQAVEEDIGLLPELVA
jgi:hypothetical protein